MTRPTRRRQPARGALLAALLCVTALPAHADGLAEVRAALGRLNGRDPIRAAVEVQIFTETKEDGKPRPEQGKGTVRVEDGPEGLKVTYSNALLERAAQEARLHRADPERTTPTEAVLREINGLDLAQSLSFAGPLALRVERATVLEERPEALAGRPAKLVVLKVEPSLPEAERKHVKESKLTLKLWLGPDGVPLAAESIMQIKAGFLFLVFTTENRERWDLARVGNRLVVTRRHQETSGAGLGQEFKRRVTEVVSVE
ncbi:MAG TPA: hypothetical protein VGR07_07755 [Thermoanaerobaculia bacterium]|jgi:hypothetical protein|nr:hypothetical protein [Thermoanaerobaculia bacterium]